MQSILDAATLVPSKVDRIDTEVHHKGNGFASLADVIDFAIVPSTEKADALVYSIQGIINRRRTRDDAQKEMQKHVTLHVIKNLYGEQVAEDGEAFDTFGKIIADGVMDIGMFGIRLVGGFLFDALAFIAEDVVMASARALFSWVIEPVFLAAMGVFANPIGLALLAAVGGVGLGWYLLEKLLGKGKGGAELKEAHERALDSTTQVTLGLPAASPAPAAPTDVAAVPRSNFDNFTPSGAAYPKPAAQPEVTNQTPPPVPYSGGSATLENAARAAQASEDKYGIPAVVSLAQFNLESAGGKRMPQGSNNPFGIKARTGDPFVESMTWEHINGKDIHIPQKFRKFGSLDEAFDYHAKLLATAKPYSKARSVINNPTAFANALTGVYATDPNYGKKLTNQFPKLMGVLASVNKDKTTSVQNGQSVRDNPVPATQPPPTVAQAAEASRHASPSGTSATSKPKTVIRGPGKTLVAMN